MISNAKPIKRAPVGVELGIEGTVRSNEMVDLKVGRSRLSMVNKATNKTKKRDKDKGGEHLEGVKS